jgi:hypothetical protein
LHPGLIFVHPVTGFHVESVHSIAEPWAISTSLKLISTNWVPFIKILRTNMGKLPPILLPSVPEEKLRSLSVPVVPVFLRFKTARVASYDLNDWNDLNF